MSKEFGDGAVETTLRDFVAANFVAAGHAGFHRAVLLVVSHFLRLYQRC